MYAAPFAVGSAASGWHCDRLDRIVRPMPTMLPSTVAVYWSRSNGTLRPDRAPASVPNIQPATAATM
jgi:hypothetical protein